MDAYIICGSVTYAYKGRDLLRSAGINAGITKPPHPKAGTGCGYAIFIDAAVLPRAEEILRKGGVKVITIENG